MRLRDSVFACVCVCSNHDKCKASATSLIQLAYDYVKNILPWGIEPGTFWSDWSAVAPRPGRYKTPYVRVKDIFSVFPYFLRTYKDPFSVLRKYGENGRNTEMRSFITLAPGVVFCNSHSHFHLHFHLTMRHICIHMYGIC